MENIIIGRAEIKDIDKLQNICTTTFTETFSGVNSEENMVTYLKENLSKEKLLSELNNSGSEFYFVTLNNKVVGYLKINFGQAQTEIKDEAGLEIERIYILKEFQRKKLGQLLFEKAMKIARQSGMKYVWLGVWEENKNAINFYKRNGFEAFDQHIFILGKDRQVDIMMKLDLEK